MSKANGRLPSVSTLTLREAAWVEEEVGMPIDRALTSTKRFTVLALVVTAFRRRDEPEYTVDQALDDYTMGQLTNMLGEEEGSVPTAAKP